MPNTWKHTVQCEVTPHIVQDKKMNGVNKMKVSFRYFYGEFKTGISKVYGEKWDSFPSGRRLCYKVWNNDRELMEWLKADACEVVA